MGGKELPTVALVEEYNLYPSNCLSDRAKN